MANMFETGASLLNKQQGIPQPGEVPEGSAPPAKPEVKAPAQAPAPANPFVGIQAAKQEVEEAQNTRLAVQAATADLWNSYNETVMPTLFRTSEIIRQNTEEANAEIGAIRGKVDQLRAAESRGGLSNMLNFFLSGGDRKYVPESLRGDVKWAAEDFQFSEQARANRATAAEAQYKTANALFGIQKDKLAAFSEIANSQVEQARQNVDSARADIRLGIDWVNFQNEQTLFPGKVVRQQQEIRAANLAMQKAQTDLVLGRQDPGALLNLVETMRARGETSVQIGGISVGIGEALEYGNKGTNASLAVEKIAQDVTKGKLEVSDAQYNHYLANLNEEQLQKVFDNGGHMIDPATGEFKFAEVTAADGTIQHVPIKAPMGLTVNAIKNYAVARQEGSRAIAEMGTDGAVIESEISIYESNGAGFAERAKPLFIGRELPLEMQASWNTYSALAERAKASPGSIDGEVLRKARDEWQSQSETVIDKTFSKEEAAVMKAQLFQTAVPDAAYSDQFLYDHTVNGIGNVGAANPQLAASLLPARSVALTELQNAVGVAVEDDGAAAFAALLNKPEKDRIAIQRKYMNSFLRETGKTYSNVIADRAFRDLFQRPEMQGKDSESFAAIDAVAKGVVAKAVEANPNLTQNDQSNLWASAFMERMQFQGTNDKGVPIRDVFMGFVGQPGYSQQLLSNAATSLGKEDPVAFTLQNRLPLRGIINHADKTNFQVFDGFEAREKQQRINDLQRIKRDYAAPEKRTAAVASFVAEIRGLSPTDRAALMATRDEKGNLLLPKNIVDSLNADGKRLVEGLLNDPKAYEKLLSNVRKDQQEVEARLDKVMGELQQPYISLWGGLGGLSPSVGAYAPVPQGALPPARPQEGNPRSSLPTQGANFENILRMLQNPAAGTSVK